MLKHAMFAAGVLAGGSTASAQQRLRAALPAAVADRVLQEMAVARDERLPAAVLEHRALELIAKGAEPAKIERAVQAHHRALARGRMALLGGGRDHPTDDEVEAAAAAIRAGVAPTAVSTLARSAASGRSLAVPLFVTSSLREQGLPVVDLVAAMQLWLEAGATDGELLHLSGQPARRPALSLIRASRRIATPSRVRAPSGSPPRPLPPRRGAPPHSRGSAGDGFPGHG
jgi:hypothetical protein